MAKKPTTSGDRPPNHHAKQHNPVAAAPIDNLEQEQRPRRAVSPDLPGKLATHGLTLATAINAFATDADKQEAQNVEAELASNGAFIRDTIVERLRNDNLRIGGLKKDDSGKRIWKKEPPSMTEDEKQEIRLSYAVGFVAQSYVIFSVINAMMEKGLVDPNRIIAWAETFSSGFDQNSSHAENADIADRLRDFARTMRLMITKPAGAGTA